MLSGLVTYTERRLSDNVNSPVYPGEGGGGGLPPRYRLMGIYRWMGSHFHDWIDYNGVAFIIELLKWGRSFSGFLG